MHFNSQLMYYTMVAGLKLCNNTVQTGSFTTAQSQKKKLLMKLFVVKVRNFTALSHVYVLKLS